MYRRSSYSSYCALYVYYMCISHSCMYLSCIYYICIRRLHSQDYMYRESLGTLHNDSEAAGTVERQECFSTWNTSFNAHRLVSRMYQPCIFTYRCTSRECIVLCPMLWYVTSDSFRFLRQIHSNVHIWLIPGGDTQSWETLEPYIHTNHLKWVDQRGLCIVVCITYGIDVFLLACIGAWYRL